MKKLFLIPERFAVGLGLAFLAFTIHNPLHSQPASNGNPGFFDQAALREKNNLQLEANLYHGLESFGLVYNFNKYVSVGGYYYRNYDFLMDQLYAGKDWSKNSLYFSGGDLYLYGASRAEIDWSGPQYFLNLKVFPIPEIPIYISGVVGRDVVGDHANHNVLLAYNTTDKYWVVSPPVWMRQDGTPYWFRTIGIGSMIHLPGGFFIDGHYTRGVYTNYTRTMHIANDQRIFLMNGLRVTDDGRLVEDSNGAMTATDLILSTVLMDARHRERGHSGAHVMYGFYVGYAFSI